MKTDNIRLRLLKVLEILKFKSDKDHPIASADILKELLKQGIEAERKSIYRDVEALCEAGFEIIKTGTPKRGFYLASGGFELPEISLLIDAVQSAGFVPKVKTQQLVEKLQGLVSEYQAAELKNRICIENRSKSTNEHIYKTIELLNQAITKCLRIKIKYAKNKLQGTSLSASVKDMVINPYALLWEADHYYLIGNNQKYDNLTHFDIIPLEYTLEKTKRFSRIL